MPQSHAQHEEEIILQARTSRLRTISKPIILEFYLTNHEVLEYFLGSSQKAKYTVLLKVSLNKSQYP
jgi:hypothetical protein